MRTIVLGAPGQLGRDLVPLLPGEVHAWSRRELDLADLPSIGDKLRQLRPTHVVNCAAYNLVDLAEADPGPAFSINAWAVRELAQVCRDIDATLMTFSTDYVFGLESSHRPWTEQDAPGPVSVYGLSKLTGEYAVRAACPKHFVVRTCGLYGIWGSGGKGGNFVETMLRVAGQNKPMRVVNDQRCTPSFTADIARTAVALLHTDRFGLYHLTNSGDCTWHELAAEIFRQSGITVDLTPITSAEFNAKAKRPPYSVLDNSKLVSAGVERPRVWQEALRDYLSQRHRRPS